MTDATTEPRPQVRGALPLGTLVARRYRIEDVLGDGASGIVYVAECIAEPGGDEGERGSNPPEGRASDPGVRVGRRVALKVIHRHLVRDRQISKRFQREARILRKLRCPHLVALLDFGEDEGGVLFMAIELVEGEPLDCIAKQGPVPVERAVAIVLQVCAALEVAHQAGVVHRDLKPGNVIVERTPEGDRARVLDFGMAKALSRELSQSLTALTEQNMVFGTPEYMAPEQARGDEVDARCDVYACGIMLYELITGSVPFQASTPIGTMTAHLVQEPAPPSSQTGAGTIPPAVEAVVLHALAKRREDRYPSAAALAEALKNAMERPADVASIAPPAPELDDLGTRDTEYALDYQPPPVPDAPPSRAGSRGWLVVAILAALVGIVLGVVFSLTRS